MKFILTAPGGTWRRIDLEDGLEGPDMTPATVESFPVQRDYIERIAQFLDEEGAIVDGKIMGISYLPADSQHFIETLLKLVYQFRPDFQFSPTIYGTRKHNLGRMLQVLQEQDIGSASGISNFLAKINLVYLEMPDEHPISKAKTYERIRNDGSIRGSFAFEPGTASIINCTALEFKKALAIFDGKEISPTPNVEHIVNVVRAAAKGLKVNSPVEILRALVASGVAENKVVALKVANLIQPKDYEQEARAGQLSAGFRALTITKDIDKHLGILELLFAKLGLEFLDIRGQYEQIYNRRKGDEKITKEQMANDIKNLVIRFYDLMHTRADLLVLAQNMGDRDQASLEADELEALQKYFTKWMRQYGCFLHLPNNLDHRKAPSKPMVIMPYVPVNSPAKVKKLMRGLTSLGLTASPVTGATVSIFTQEGVSSHFDYLLPNPDGMQYMDVSDGVAGVKSNVQVKAYGRNGHSKMPKLPIILSLAS